jgi:type IV pilus biogenesis protein CpaD/CtpE
MLMTLGACKPAPQESAFFSRGGPEVLLDVSSEVVNLDIANSAKPDELSVWISKDKPTRAELYCIANDPRCKQAEKLLKSQSIATAVIPSADNSVALIYERILARDCNQRFVDNTHDYYNAPHPAFGCSTSANIVQHVSNKREFVNPNLSDTPSAVGGVAAYQRAYAPTTNTPQSYNVDSALSKQ